MQQQLGHIGHAAFIALPGGTAQPPPHDDREQQRRGEKADRHPANHARGRFRRCHGNAPLAPRFSARPSPPVISHYWRNSAACPAAAPSIQSVIGVRRCHQSPEIDATRSSGRGDGRFDVRRARAGTAARAARGRARGRPPASPASPASDGGQPQSPRRSWPARSGIPASPCRPARRRRAGRDWPAEFDRLPSSRHFQPLSQRSASTTRPRRLHVHGDGDAGGDFVDDFRLALAGGGHVDGRFDEGDAARIEARVSAILFKRALVVRDRLDAPGHVDAGKGVGIGHDPIIGPGEGRPQAAPGPSWGTCVAGVPRKMT